MGILEATRALGAEMQKDERFIAFAKAKLAYKMKAIKPKKHPQEQPMKIPETANRKTQFLKWLILLKAEESSARRKRRLRLLQRLLEEVPKALSTFIIAILIISAAVPCMGLFIATRSPKCLRFLFCAESSWSIP